MIKGRLKLDIVQDGKRIGGFDDHNLITMSGKQLIAFLLTGEPGNNIITKIGVGDNNSLPVLSDIGLSNAYLKPVAGHTLLEPTVIQWHFTIDTTEANGLNISEFGLFSEGEQLFSRKIRSSAISKDDSITLFGYWTIWLLECKKLTFSSSAYVDCNMTSDADMEEGDTDNIIVSGVDDGSRFGATGFSDTGSSIIIGAVTDSTYYKGFFNFTNVQIPQGETLTSFEIELYCNANGSSNHGQERAVFAFAVLSDNAVSPTTYQEYDALTKSSNVGGANMLLGMPTDAWWTFDDIYVDEPFNQPGLMGAVQEVIDRVGWTIGNNLMILVEGFAGGGVSDYNVFSTYESSNPARINFTY